MNKFRNFGFTLIELLVVMALMLMLMGIGAAGYFGIRRGAEMRGAISTVRTTLMLARQQAVTKRKPMRVEFVASTGTGTNYLKVVAAESTGATGEVHRTAYLPQGVEFSGTPSPITFSPIGGAGGTAQVVLRERVVQASGVQGMATVTVWQLTGVTKVQ
jgi:prepilin-type N-terminal cleavage/methylation domain-containing protein